MSVKNYEELKEHVGHKIECVMYGEQNASLECIDCMCVLIDFDKEEQNEN